MATSSPSLMRYSGSPSPWGRSTYSRLTVTNELSNTFEHIPAYLSSSTLKSCDNGSGASNVSESLDVKELADAK